MYIDLETNDFNIKNIETRSLTIFTGIDTDRITNLAKLVYSEYCNVVGTHKTKLVMFPECKLHPKKQTQYARDIAKLINEGYYIFLVTHSDYMLKEFNILFNYKRIRTVDNTFCQQIPIYTNDMSLDISDIIAYDLSVILKTCLSVVDDDDMMKQINYDEIDYVITTQNQIQESIIWRND